MASIYHVFLLIYYSFLRIAALILPKAKLWIDGRKKTLGIVKKSETKNCIWFHASSLGEFEQISYLIECIKTNYPSEQILVSFFSPSGYEVKKNFKYADSVVYLPFDFKSDIKAFIDIIEPKLVIWVRYEFWLNSLEYLKVKKVPIILLNGVFRDQVSFFYKPYLVRCLRCFTEISVINETSQRNLLGLGFNSVIRYDTRYSRMQQVSNTPFTDDIVQHFAHHHQVAICGSIWPKDDDILIESIYRYTNIQWILVPHEVDVSRIENLCKKFPEAQRYSAYDFHRPTNILIIDTIGILARLYRYADFAYVGGGFDKVVHSLVEPMAYAIPILVGKNIMKSEEAIDFVRLGLVYQVHSSMDCMAKIEELNSGTLEDKRSARQTYFQNRVNTVSKLMLHIDTYIRASDENKITP